MACSLSKTIFLCNSCGNVNTNVANRNNTNINFDGNDEANGGYNHSELRRYKRDYTLPGVFNEGDVADPMGQAGEWMRLQYE